MAKLYFRYGAMNSGKSTALLQAAYNYEERGQQVLLAKPAIDSKGEAAIVSRLGVDRPVDFTIAPEEDVLTAFMTRREQVIRDSGKDVACLLLDEVQFLSEQQIDDLLRIAIDEDVPVLAYGIRTDFQTVAFPGSRRLLEIAHSLEELKTICRCGRKAIFNARTVDGVFVFDGDQVAIDATTGEQGDVSYESLCGQCYLEESGGVLNRGRRSKYDFSYNSAPDADFS
ncbi:thymidine kinase [Pseudolysinimonas sp.]|jgi:thymidine kinase|uniref:thymidine kinase n=1 Tax=Pseudolysinimonas sp. TaxID=2680009 RepID=UPI003783455F